MCQCLNIPRSSYHHYKAVVLVSEAQLEENFRSLEELTLKTTGGITIASTVLLIIKHQ